MIDALRQFSEFVLGMDVQLFAEIHVGNALGCLVDPENRTDEIGAKHHRQHAAEDHGEDAQHQRVVVEGGHRVLDGGDGGVQHDVVIGHLPVYIDGKHRKQAEIIGVGLGVAPSADGGGIERPLPAALLARHDEEAVEELLGALVSVNGGDARETFGRIVEKIETVVQDDDMDIVGFLHRFEHGAHGIGRPSVFVGVGKVHPGDRLQRGGQILFLHISYKIY